MSFIEVFLAALHGKNRYVYVAENMQPKFDFSNEYLHSFFTSYSYMILGLLTIFVMILACAMGIFYRMPDYDSNVISKMPVIVRALLSIFGGIMSMMYLVHTDGGISIKTVFLVGLCSYITPATFHLIHAACVKAVSLLAEIFVKRIVYLFTGVVVEKPTNIEETPGDQEDEP